MVTGKRLVINENNNLYFFSKQELYKLNIDRAIWQIVNAKSLNYYDYIIKNKYTNNLLEIDDSNNLKCLNKVKITEDIKINFVFSFINLCKEYNFTRNSFQIIKKENIDLIIKYIDLTDKALNRQGIQQIYKDQDNEELRYTIRGIFQYIPWIRKIYIIMPNEKIKFFKPIEEIKDKFSYIRDKDLLGFDSANIFAFTFNLYKLKNFGVTKNFIYMEDDFFIGKNLVKNDFFYYDESNKIILPFLFQNYFKEMNETEMLEKKKKIIENVKDIESIPPHSGDGWWLSIYNTNLYFINKFKSKLPFVNTQYNHVASAENLDDMKKIYDSIQDYEYLNETIYSRKRHILTLNQPQYRNIYKINIMKRFNHYIPNKYIKVENINHNFLYSPLYVINIGGNHEPSKRQLLLQKKLMIKRYPYPTIYEINNKFLVKIEMKLHYFIILKILIFILIIKISTTFHYFI